MMSSHQSQDHDPLPHDTNAQGERSELRTRRPRWQLLVWLLLAAGLLLWLAIGTVTTTSYTYNQFLHITFRDESDTSIKEIWTSQTENLPDVRTQWALDSMFVLSTVAIVVCVIAGCWLLLVRSSDPQSHQRHRSRRFPHHESI